MIRFDRRKRLVRSTERREPSGAAGARLLGARCAIALVVVVTLATCATASPPRGGPGDPCEGNEQCGTTLVCKGAACAAPRSVVGGVCVTDGGCAANLSCVRGRCSVGLAADSDCDRACEHVHSLMVDELELETGGPPREAGVRNDDADLLDTLADFGERCRDRCYGRASVESASCLESAPDLSAVSACP